MKEIFVAVSYIVFGYFMNRNEFFLRMEDIMEAVVSELVVYLLKYVVLIAAAVGGVFIGIQVKKKKSNKA